MARRHAPNLAPRLLDHGQAAAYCNVCVSVFDTACPVAAIEIKPGLKRWDRHALDRWIDGMDSSIDRGDLAGAWDDWHERKSKRA